MSIFGPQKALERLSERLLELSHKVEDVERTNRKLDLEFTELYDKVRHQMSRMAKRNAVVAKENGEEPPEEPVLETDPISASILRRRGMVRTRT